MAIYLFSQILKFTLYSIKLIEKLSRRHLINSFDVFVIKGFTVVKPIFKEKLLIKFFQTLCLFSSALFSCHRRRHGYQQLGESTSL